MLPFARTFRWLLAAIFFVVAGQVFGHGMSDAEKQMIIDGGNLRFTWLGMSHMLSGYDHLAFVFGIVFFLTRFKDVVKYITAFTLGHSVTLILATFLAIQVNYYVIDAVIALSVVYIAFHNLGGFEKWLGMKAPNMLAMIFALGLIHGLGLSTRLQQLPLSEEPLDLLLNIVSFNIGIEIGQILALAAMLVLLNIFRKRASFAAFSTLANGLLIWVGTLLFLMQMHGYEHSVSAEAAQQPLSSVGQDDLEDGNLPNDWDETITVLIPAQGGKEYKLNLLKGAKLAYQWSASESELYFDFHGEPKGDTSGYFESFEIATKPQSSGVLVAPFDGTHGWYWKNTQDFPVKVLLNVKGQYQRMD